MDGASEEEVRVWLNTLVPKIVTEHNYNADDVQYEFSVPGDSFYLSSMYFVNISWRSLKNPSQEKRESLKIIVKRPSRNEETRILIKSDIQFHNEILFYRKYARGSERYPRSIYLEEKPQCDSVIALEDVRERGYKLCPWKYDIPLEYTLAAMREIGRFHGRGYVMKERRREAFFGVVTEIQESRFVAAGPDNTFMEYVNLMSTRAVQHLRAKSYDEKFCDKMDLFLGDAYKNVMMRAAEIVEPLATMCHGDFTMNNALFNEEEGVLKTMLIDFALLRYGSPVIDLSTFFCLSCPQQLKKPEFEVLLQAYHQALTGYLAENDIIDPARYSYEVFFNEHKKHGLFGFVIASFYLAVQMGHQTLTPHDMFSMSIKEAAEVNLKSGGEEVSEILATMLLDLKELGCLDSVL